MKQLEKDIVAAMRMAIANYYTDPSLASKSFHTFHRLFADHIGKWSENFAALWQQMYEIWCAYTPKPTGHYHRTSIEIGYTSHPIATWMNDKVQPPVPTTRELLGRFDRLIRAYPCTEEAT